MDFGLYMKCIDDAAKFPEPFKVLILAGWGEPLTHPQIVKMVEYAKIKRIAERIEIVSNGILLTHQLSDKLIAAGLDRIRISIQGLDSVKCREVAGVDVDFEILVDNIRYFYEHRKQARIFVKTIDAALPSDSDRMSFHAIFGNICDEIAIEQVIPVIREIDHSKFGIEFNKRHCGGEAVRVSVCPFPFYMSVIHPDGSYAPCCSPDRPMDFGNIGNTTITEIWKSEVLRRFRIDHLEDRRGASPICSVCPRPQYDIQQGDNLDPCANKLIPLYSLESTNERTSQ
jgi:MoaA/NifB/PqqE/SkfB family radical SAM enzyme